jgi:hypothetical protein
MKSILKAILTLSLAAVLSAATSASAARAPKHLNLCGSFVATEQHGGQFPIITIALQGHGHASHLGHFEIVMDATLNAPTRSAVGTATFTRANGDQLFSTVAGQATPTVNPNVISILEIHTITGGTGRFEGATGTITVTRRNNSVTLMSCAVLEGSVLVPRSH